MSVKQFLSFLKTKGVEATADEVASFADAEKPEVKPLNVEPSPIQNNLSGSDFTKQFNELKEIFEKKLAEKDLAIEKLSAQIKDFTSESLKKEEERAAKEKAFADEQEKQRLEKLTADRKVLIDEAVKQGKIAPKDEKITKRLETLDLDAVKDIIEAMPSKQSGTDTGSGTHTTTQKPQSYDAPLKASQTINEYLSDLQIQ